MGFTISANIIALNLENLEELKQTRRRKKEKKRGTEVKKMRIRTKRKEIGGVVEIRESQRET